MDLKEFIFESLTQICNGISQAKKQTGNYPGTSVKKLGEGTEEKINFDISLTVTVSNTNNAQGKLESKYLLEIVGLHGNVSGTKEQNISNVIVQKINFAVPYNPSLL